MPVSQAITSQQGMLIFLNVIALLTLSYLSNAHQVFLEYCIGIIKQQAETESKIEKYQCICLQIVIFILILKWFEILFRGVIRFLFTFWEKNGDRLKFTAVMTFPATFSVALYSFKYVS